MQRHRRARAGALLLLGFAGGIAAGFLASLLRGPDERDVAGVGAKRVSTPEGTA